MHWLLIVLLFLPFPAMGQMVFEPLFEPSEPIGPTEMTQCTALSEAYLAYQTALSRASSQCMASYGWHYEDQWTSVGPCCAQVSGPPTAWTHACAKPPACAPLYEKQICARQNQRAKMQRCMASVARYQLLQRKRAERQPSETERRYDQVQESVHKMYDEVNPGKTSGQQLAKKFFEASMEQIANQHKKALRQWEATRQRIEQYMQDQQQQAQRERERLARERDEREQRERERLAHEQYERQQAESAQRERERLATEEEERERRRQEEALDRAYRAQQQQFYNTLNQMYQHNSGYSRGSTNSAGAGSRSSSPRRKCNCPPGANCNAERC